MTQHYFDLNPADEKCDSFIGITGLTALPFKNNIRFPHIQK